MIVPIILGLGGALLLVRSYCASRSDHGFCAAIPKALLPTHAKGTPYPTPTQMADADAEKARQREETVTAEAARKAAAAAAAKARGSPDAAAANAAAAAALAKKNAASEVRRRKEARAARTRKGSAKRRATVTATVEEMDKAAKLAGVASGQVKRFGRLSNKNYVRAFQVAAKNLEPDGLYGGRTAGAAKFFLGDKATKPIYNPKRFITWTPPNIVKGKPTPPGAPPKKTPSQAASKKLQALDKAAAAGIILYEDLMAKPGRSYSKIKTLRFQLFAGLSKDSIYGPKTASALKFYIGDKAPAPRWGSTSQKAGKGPVPPYSPPA